MGLGLVPVGDGREEIAAVVPVPVLDRHLDGSFERDGIGDVEAIDRGLGPGLEVLFLDGTPVKEAPALAHAPGVREIVLGARAVEGRHRLAVHADHVVAFAPPAHGPLENAQVAADVVAGPLRFEEKIIPPAVGRELLPVLGVEGGRVGGEIGELAVVDVVVEGIDGPRALVPGRDAAGAAEGHIPVAVPGPALRRAGDRQGGEIPVQSVADAEEVADRRLDRRGPLAVPIDAEDDLPAVERFRRDRRPDVMDGRGPFDLGQDRGLPGLDDDRIAVPTAPVKGRDAAAAVILLPAEALQQVLAGRRRGSQEDCGEDQRA